jgi:hypothetical protein
MGTDSTIDWHTVLIDQLDWHWQNHLRPRLDGLTDEEYRWEPIPGCWNVHKRAGQVRLDFEYPEPTPAPITTIAWRLGHMSIGVFGMRASNHFGDSSVDYQTTSWPYTAAGGLALLDEHYGMWLSGVRGLTPEALKRPCGPAEGPYAEHPFAELIVHINREAIHHGAEVSLLRDLYRARFTAR